MSNERSDERSNERFPLRSAAGLRVLLVDGSTDGTARFRSLARGPLYQLAPVADVQHALAALRDHDHDVVVIDGSTAAPHVLRRLRDAAPGCALVVLCNGASVVPLQPEDVGERTTLDLVDMDRRTMALTLQLAVERHRVARLLSAMEPGPADGRPTGAGSSRDPVTGLVSGEVLLEGIDRMIADAVRFNRPLTVAVAQVDGLEGLRASLGPAGLDRVLVQVVGLLLADLRSCDLVGRLDAGQFVMGLSATSTRAAMLPLHRLQQAVRSAAPPTPVSPPTTLSVGVCGLQGLMSVDEMVVDALRAAEAAAAGGGDGLALSDRRAATPA